MDNPFCYSNLYVKIKEKRCRKINVNEGGNFYATKKKV